MANGVILSMFAARAILIVKIVCFVVPVMNMMVLCLLIKTETKPIGVQNKISDGRVWLIVRGILLLNVK